MTENMKMSVSSINSDSLTKKEIEKNLDDDFDYKAEDPWSLITSYFGLRVPRESN